MSSCLLRAFIQKINNYEPELVYKIYNYIFIDCCEDFRNIYKYVIAIKNTECDGKCDLKFLPKHICNSAFIYNTKLKMIIINDNIQSIFANAFAHCINLVSIDLPNTLKYINRGAFSYCHSLKKIKIPGSVKKIKDLSFFSCSKLEYVYIDDLYKNNCIDISANSFTKCPSLKTVSMPKIGVLYIFEEQVPYKVFIDDHRNNTRIEKIEYHDRYSFDSHTRIVYRE